MSPWLLIIPILSAISGWMIAWLICKRILVSTTLHQKFLSELDHVVRHELPGISGIEQRLSDPTLLRSAGPVIEKHVDDFLRIRLNKEMPFISHFIGDKTIDSLKKIFMEELEQLFPEVMKGFVQNIKNDLSSTGIAKELSEKFPIEKFRAMLTKALSKDVRKIMLMASLVGFFFGVLELVILYLTL